MKQIKERRTQLGLTLQQVADRLGVAEATVQRWESGNIQNVRAYRIPALCRVLGLTPNELFDWEEVESQ